MVTRTKMLGAWLLLASMSVYLSASWCAVSQAHVYCSEHGAWEHVEGSQDDSAPAPSLAADENRYDAANAPDATEHDLCGFTHVRTTLSGLTAPDARFPLVASTVALPAFEGARQIIPLLALAPKSSPPTFALS